MHGLSLHFMYFLISFSNVLYFYSFVFLSIEFHPLYAKYISKYLVSFDKIVNDAISFYIFVANILKYN